MNSLKKEMIILTWLWQNRLGYKMPNLAFKEEKTRSIHDTLKKKWNDDYEWNSENLRYLLDSAVDSKVIDALVTDLSKLNSTLRKEANDLFSQAIKEEIQSDLVLLSREDHLSLNKIESLLEKANKPLIEDQIGDLLSLDDLLTKKTSFIDPGYQFMREADVGFQKGQLVTYQALPGNGKTQIKVALACELIRQGKNILYFSLEETADQIKQKIQANLFGLDFSTREKKELTEANLNQIKAKIANTNTENWGQAKYYAIASPTSTEIENLLIQVKTQVDIDAIFIDYSGLIEASKTAASQHEANNQIIKHLRTLALKYDVLTVTSIQSNRQAATGNAGLHTVADSMGGPRHSDHMFSVSRIGPYEDPITGERAMVYRLQVDKSRSRLQEGKQYEFMVHPIYGHIMAQTEVHHIE